MSKFEFVLFAGKGKYTLTSSRFSLIHQLLKEILKSSQSSAVVIDLFTPPYNFIKFCHIYFEIMLFGAYKFGVALSLW